MLLRWLYTSRGGTGYVNQGPDRRIGGLVGTVLAWTQRALSFHSATPPFACIYRRDGWKVGIEFSRPGLLPFVLVFIPRDDLADWPRWWSFRAGCRHDEHWGRGGYIADLILKSRIDNWVE